MITCKRCGAECEVSFPEKTIEYFANKGEPFPWLCSTCFEIVERERSEKQKKEDYDEEAELDEAVLKAGVAPKYALRYPLFPYVSDFLLDNADSSILLSGETGTGKSTSAGYFVREMLRKGHSVGMHYLGELMDDWRDARKADRAAEACQRLFSELESGDYIVIDECAGKTVNTDSSREFMFRFLEDLTNGRCTSHVILLGNFYTGSIADMFGDEAPAMRRIRERFVCGRIDPKKKTVTLFK